MIPGAPGTSPIHYTSTGAELREYAVVLERIIVENHTTTHIVALVQPVEDGAINTAPKLKKPW
jgi:hypothetical protein